MEATQPGPAADVRSKIRPQLKSVTQAYGPIAESFTEKISIIYPFPRHWEIPMLKVEELLKFIAIQYVLFY